MVEILIRNGDTEAAADELAAALHDIFAVAPIRRVSTRGHTPGTRGLVELVLIALALPPAVVGTSDIAARMQFGQRLQRLIAKVAALRKTTHVTVLIDAGDGKQIPLEEAHREAIIAAVHAIEQRLKT